MVSHYQEKWKFFINCHNSSLEKKLPVLKKAIKNKQTSEIDTSLKSNIKYEFLP